MAFTNREPIEEEDYEGEEIYYPDYEGDLYRLQEPYLEGLLILYSIW